MKAVSSSFRAACFLGLALLAGCASRTAEVDPAAYAAMSCSELNAAMGETAKSVTKLAISRGDIGKLGVPPWVPGGAKAVSALQERRTTQIDALRAQEQAIDAARRARCSGQG